MTARLREILARAGLAPDLVAHPLAGTSHEVWIGDEVVIRIAREGAAARLARERAIAARLAPQVRYPVVVAAGDGWMITERARGEQLARAWPTMRMADRERAIGELADMLEALHATDATGIRDDDLDGPHAVSRATAVATAERAAYAVGNDVVLMLEAGALLRERWDAAFGDHDAFIHGDPHFENVLWDPATRTVSALVDLEWARRGYRECDVEILLAVASHPALFAASDYAAALDPETFRAIPDWLRRAKPAWFAHPHLAERVVLLHAVRTLGHLVDAPGVAIRHAHLRALIGRA